MKYAQAVAAAAMSVFVGSAAAATNYSDIWWNPLESGWGVTIADHETNIFGVLYAYRSDNKPVWYTIPGGTFSQGRRMFAGDVYATRGPSYTNPVFDSHLVTASKVGNATFDFAPPGLAEGVALFSYSINGVSQSKQIERQAFGSSAPNWGFDRTDLWFNSAESGWGLALAQHGNNIFGVWYTYDTDGSPLWFVLPGGTFTASNSFSADLYRTTGPYLGNSAFDPRQVAVTKAGSATITFDGTTAISSKVLATELIGQDACPGFGANFVATVGAAPIPRLICRQAFGNLAPTPVRGTCTGTYSITLTLSFCAPGPTAFPSHGNFTTDGVDYGKLGPFLGDLIVTGVPDILSVVSGCQASNTTTTETPAYTGAMDLSSIGHADFVISGLPVHASFSVGTSEVLGTLNATYSGMQVLSGQFSCTY